MTQRRGLIRSRNRVIIKDELLPIDWILVDHLGALRTIQRNKNTVPIHLNNILLHQLILLPQQLIELEETPIFIELSNILHG
ncbi:hypothetical protein D3C71_1593730 [compost metagenome]